ncbi:MAG: hypothetical protein Kow0062_00690 [Acidobacteriota bacterium]
MGISRRTESTRSIPGGDRGPRRAGWSLRPLLPAAAAIALLVVGTARGATRPIQFDELSTDQGLSQSSVLVVFQDSVGYLWVGTEDGLNRYDGLGFEVFKHDPLAPTSLPGNFVWGIDEDGRGNLWVATEDGGVAFLDRTTGAFTRIDIGADEATRAIHVAPDGSVWIAMRSAGVRRLAPDGVIREYRAAYDGLPDDHVYVLHRDGAGVLWVGTDAGLARYDAERDRFETVFAPGTGNGLSGPRVRSIMHDRRGRLWVGTWESGLNVIDPARGVVGRYRHDPERKASLAHDRVRALLEDDAGRIWVGTSGGLDLYDPRTDGFEHYGHDPTDPFSLRDDHVMTLLRDRGGVIWVGTRFAGLHKWHPRAWQFGHRRSIDDDSTSPSRVTAFTEDSLGRLWIGAFGEGLAVVDRARGTTKRFRHDDNAPSSLASDRVTALFTDRDGTVWVGTIDAGFDRFDPQADGFDHYPHVEGNPDSPGASGISSFAQDADGLLWIGTFGGGVARFDPGSGRFVHFRHDPEDPGSLASDRVTAVRVAPDGQVWVGTHGGGVSVLDPSTGQARHLRHDRTDPRTLPSDLVYAIHIEPHGVAWIGTTGGLSRVSSRPDGTFALRNFRERDGLPNDVVYSVQQDRSGGIWASTNRGLVRIDSSTGRIDIFDRSDGLQDFEFNFGAGFARHDGELLFGGINGYNAFLPERLARNTHAPPVVVAKVSLDHRPVASPPDQISLLELDYARRTVSFTFAALDYQDPQRNRIAYRLDGFDEDWVETMAGTPVTYTNLDPGEYALRVRAANADGTWNEQDLTIGLRVEAPPWRSPWAYGGYAVGMLTFVLGFVQVQRRKVAREEQYSRMLEEQVRFRTRQLAERTRELERVNKRLATASLTDSLTGFANRRFLIEYLEKEIRLVQRRYAAARAGSLDSRTFDLAFLMIDLDQFKSVNDTFGHCAGDEVLRQLRSILDDACRGSDIVIRWGGDEFLVVARDQDAEAVARLAERIRTRIAGHAFEVGRGQVIRTTCSIGYACYPFLRDDIEALTWEQVIGIADRALYVAKRSGRNAWVGFESTPSTEDAALLAGLRHGLEQLVADDQLRMHTSIDGNTRTIAWTMED